MKRLADLYVIEKKLYKHATACDWSPKTDHDSKKKKSKPKKAKNDGK